MKWIYIEDITARDLTPALKRNFLIKSKSQYLYEYDVSRLPSEIHLVDGLK